SNQSITLSLQSITLTLQPITLTLQCRCNGRLVNGVDPRSITRFELFPPGSICDKVDIIVTMKKQICVNPNSKMVKNILSVWGVPRGRSPRAQFS
uniref:Chemokine interleukin-8-like domain-containing protein n=1 Tax=Leptobrachium leishanense TaxID=445787 RepID=A0A8C5N567_9ANUR